MSMMSWLSNMGPWGPWAGASVGMAVLIAILAIWTIPWKGVALWKSAKNNQIVWFIVFLIVNTLGILEILYIFVFSKMKPAKKRRR